SPIISSIKFTSQMAWHAHSDVAMYSASQDDNATTDSFLEHQVIGAPPNKNTYPAIDFLSSASPHQFESV
ncbi:hypothetical protein A2U01_0070369, partial [Trifolium medium]|nr:hypothetical protein [Trifolium medium]